MKNIVTLVLFALTLSFASALENLATWGGSTASNTWTASTWDSSVISPPPTITSGAALSRDYTISSPVAFYTPTLTSLESAKALDSSFNITLNATNSHALLLETVSFSHFGFTTGGDYLNLAMFSSQDNFSNQLATVRFAFDGGSWNVDLTGMNPVADNIVLKTYVWGTYGDSGSSWYISNGSNNYSVTVVGSHLPEPSTYALIFGSVVVCFAAVSRYKKNKISNH